MARKQQSIAIEGWTYELSQLGAVEGRTLVLLFLKLLGRFAPLLANGAKLDANALDAISTAIATVDANELEPLWEAFARHAQVRGKDGKTRVSLHDIFDDHFAGEYFAMVKFFIESARLNFGDFLAKALGQAGAHGDAATP